MNWMFEEPYSPDQAAELGNRFFIGNGQLGVRGTLDESGPEQLSAVNIAGLYDGLAGKWRETVNAPNCFYGYLVVDDEVLDANRDSESVTAIALDLKRGEFLRRTTFVTPRGNVRFETIRFVSMRTPGLGAQKYRISADFHADIRLVTGIDCNIWDINGPHLEQFEYSTTPFLSVSAVTQEKKKPVCVSAYMKTDLPCQKKLVKEDNRILYEFNFITDTGRVYEFEKLISVGQDRRQPDGNLFMAGNIADVYEKWEHEHTCEWSRIWATCEVEIEGDEAAEFALNYSIYQQYSIAPVKGSGLSIPARGLSGQTYKGAVFWDTEIFMMDLFINTDPAIARELIMYRVNGLKGAREKAAKYGYDGAFYAWESQGDGFDACSDYNVTDVFTGRPMRTYFRDKQVHISAAVVYAIKQYVEATGDKSVLTEGAGEVILECARFYLSMLWQRPRGSIYEIRDVIGPDEYHERVNNNAYTNGMALFTMESALELLRSGETTKLLKRSDADELRVRLEDAVQKLYMPRPDENMLVPQFDGYFDMEDTIPPEVKARLLDPREYWGGAYGVASGTQVIKQADVIAYMALFPDCFTAEVKRKNWEYYEVRTEHGSSLSSCMYGLVACECGLVERAYDMFLKSARADLVVGGKEWAGLIYIGGVHPAAHGGAYMLALRGFAGMRRDDFGLCFTPRLPGKWKSLSFTVMDHDKKYRVKLDGTNVTLKEIEM